MEIVRAQKDEAEVVQTEGIPIDPLASRAAENILEILNQLSINFRETGALKIPLVSAYVQGMQALPHDTEIDFDILKEQIHYSIARKLAMRALNPSINSE
jgi:hypothetical protein